MKRIVASLSAAALLLAGCSNVVDGKGSPAGGTPTNDFPTPTAGPSDSSGPGATDTLPVPSTSAGSGGSSPAGGDYTCPSVTFPSAHMSFTCVSDGMTQRAGNGSFPITLAQTVEAGTGWQMETGAAPYNGTSTSFAAVASDIRGKAIDSGSYGDDPTNTIDDVTSSTISGHPAYTVADTVTLNPSWAKKEGTAVKVEKRWLVLVEYVTGKFTAWYVTIPDISKTLWTKVPSVIASIKVSL